MFNFISNVFFKNSGKRLQKVAVAFFIIQAIAAIGGGIFMFVIGLIEFDMFGLCFAAPFATLGAIGVACLDSLFLYGFGELIENTSYLRPNETKTPKTKASHTISSNKDNNAGKDTSTNIKNSINPAPTSADVPVFISYSDDGKYWICPECCRDNPINVVKCKCGYKKDN